jgi:hypothetical protein
MKIYKGITIETSTHEKDGSWMASAEILSEAGDVNALAGTMLSGFKTQDEAEAAALDWTIKEIDKMVV